MFTHTVIRQILRYMQMTVISASITLGLPVVLHEALGVGQEIAVAIGLIVAFFVNFVSVRRYVFDSEGAASGEFIKFLIFAVGFRFSEYGAFILLHTVFGIFYVAALGGILVISLALKFLCYRFFVFKPPAIFMLGMS